MAFKKEFITSLQEIKNRSYLGRRRICIKRTSSQTISLEKQKGHRHILFYLIIWGGCLAVVICTVFLVRYLLVRQEAKKSLYDAIENGDQQTVIEVLDRFPKLLNEGYYVIFVPIDAPNSFPLYEAVKSGNLDMVRLLVEKGANINDCALYCAYPLHKALVWGDYDIAWYLINNGANLSLKSGNWEESVPFCILAQKIEPNDTEKEQTQFELLKYVLEQGVSLEPPVGSYEGIKTLLGLAAYQNNALVIKYLLDEQLYNIDEIVNPEFTKKTALIIIFSFMIFSIVLTILAFVLTNAKILAASEIDFKNVLLVNLSFLLFHIFVC